MTGALAATSNNGNVTETGALTVTGTANINAGTGTIILAQANDFQGAVTLTGGATQITDINTLDLASSAIAGDLTVVAGGAITDSGTLTIAGATNLAAGGANDIVLDSATNDFVGNLTIASAKDVVLVDANDVRFGGASSLKGHLMVTAGGNIGSASDASVMATTAKLLAGGTIGTYSTPFLLALTDSTWNALKVQAGAKDSSGVSVHVKGAIPGYSMEAVDPAKIPGLLMLNGVPLNWLQLPEVNPMAGSAVAATVAQSTVTANGGIGALVPPVPASVADVFRAVAFKTDNVGLQMTFGSGTIGMVSPVFHLSGEGINLSGDMIDSLKRQRDEEGEEKKQP